MDLLQTIYDQAWRQNKKTRETVNALSLVAIDLGLDDEERDAALDAGDVHTTAGALALTEMIRDRLLREARIENSRPTDQPKENAMKHEKREISIPKGTIVEGSQSGLVTLKADVHVEAIRESDGCWLYEIRDESFRCAGGSAS